ncbi:unnamed protein product, partial [Closterium sp. NIES-54]
IRRPVFGPGPLVFRQSSTSGAALRLSATPLRISSRLGFLGFPVDSPDFSFYHPPLYRFLDSRDVWFDKSVSYYTQYPCQGLPVPPPPLFLAPSPPPAPALPRCATGGTWPGGAHSRVAGAGGAGTRGASFGGAGAGGAGTGGASSRGAGAGDAGTRGASFGGAGTGGIDTGGSSTKATSA